MADEVAHLDFMRPLLAGPGAGDFSGVAHFDWERPLSADGDGVEDGEEDADGAVHFD